MLVLFIPRMFELLMAKNLSRSRNNENFRGNEKIYGTQSTRSGRAQFEHVLQYQTRSHHVPQIRTLHRILNEVPGTHGNIVTVKVLFFAYANNSIFR